MPKKLGKPIVVAIRLTRDQRSQLDQAIKVSGLSASAYSRELILSKPLVFHESALDGQRLVKLYEKAGIYLNQVAYQVNASFRRGVLNQAKFVQWLNKIALARSFLIAAVLSINLHTASITSAHKHELPVDTTVKDTPFSFRLTLEQAVPLQHLAEKIGTSLPLVCRRLLLVEFPVFKRLPTYKKRLVFIYNKASNNITQLTLRANKAHKKKVLSEPLYCKWLEILTDIETLFQTGINHAD